MGRTSWLANTVKPQLLCAVSFINSTIHIATVKHLNLAIQTIRKIDPTTAKIVFRPMDWKCLKIVMFTDASLGNAEDLRTQAGYAIFLSDGRTYNPLSFSSAKLRRVTRSTFASELLSLGNALDAQRANFDEAAS